MGKSYFVFFLLILCTVTSFWAMLHIEISVACRSLCETWLKDYTEAPHTNILKYFAREMPNNTAVTSIQFLIWRSETFSCRFRLLCNKIGKQILFDLCSIRQNLRVANNKQNVRPFYMLSKRGLSDRGNPPYTPCFKGNSSWVIFRHGIQFTRRC